MLAHAWREVPFQRRRLEAAGLRPQDVRTLEDLRRLPPCTRAEVQAQPARDLVARGLDPERMRSVLTSGSTGEPLRIRGTTASKRVHGLLRLRLQQRLGVRPTDHLARVVYVRPRRPGEGAIAGALARLGLFRVSSVSCLQPAACLLRELQWLRPDVLTGFPSALAEVADLAAGALPRVRPRLVLLGGEVADAGLRRRIAAAFAAPIRDVYSCYESGVLAWECGQTGELHVHAEGVVLEILDGERPCEPGETGEVVVTNLHGWAMPFVRYRLGDLATAGELRCRCSLPYPTLRAVAGRVVDLFPLADGRLLHPYALTAALVAEGEAWFRRYELEQRDETTVVLRLVLAPDAPADALERLAGAVSRVLGATVALRIEAVEEIRPDASGKVRPMRSRVTRGVAAPSTHAPGEADAPLA